MFHGIILMMQDKLNVCDAAISGGSIRIDGSSMCIVFGRDHVHVPICKNGDHPADQVVLNNMKF